MYTVLPREFLPIDNYNGFHGCTRPPDISCFFFRLTCIGFLRPHAFCSGSTSARRRRIETTRWKTTWRTTSKPTRASPEIQIRIWIPSASCVSNQLIAFVESRSICLSEHNFPYIPTFTEAFFFNPSPCLKSCDLCYWTRLEDVYLRSNLPSIAFFVIAFFVLKRILRVNSYQGALQFDLWFFIVERVLRAFNFDGGRLVAFSAHRCRLLCDVPRKLISCQGWGIRLPYTVYHTQDNTHPCIALGRISQLVSLKRERGE